MLTINSITANINSFVKKDIYKQQINIYTTHNKGTILLNYFFCKKLFLTLNSLHVTKFILGTKSFWNFNDGVPIIERQGLKGRHLPTMFLCTLQGPQKIPVLILCSIRQAPDDFKDFR